MILSGPRTVGETVAIVNRWGTVRKGEVLKVSPGGRSTIRVTNSDGHAYERKFDAKGWQFPKATFDNDHLEVWAGPNADKYEIDVRGFKNRQRSQRRQEAREEDQRDKDRKAREYLRTLAEAAPASQLRLDALDLLSRW